jgi:hypothetical protein
LVNRVEGHFLSDFEVHAVDLFQGNGVFAGVPIDRRLEIVNAMLAVVEQQSLDFIYVRIDKERHRLKYRYPDPPDKLAFMLMAELFEKYLANSDGEKTGMFIADYSAQGDKLKVDLVRYQERGTPYYFGIKINRIIDSVHFVRSVESPCTQLADVCAYLTLQTIKQNQRWQAYCERVKAFVKSNQRFP